MSRPVAHHLGADLDQLFLVIDYRFAAPAITMVRMKSPTLWVSKCDSRQTVLAGEKRHNSRVHVFALVLSIHCSGVPRCLISPLGQAGSTTTTSLNAAR